MGWVENDSQVDVIGHVINQALTWRWSSTANRPSCDWTVEDFGRTKQFLGD